MIVRGSPEDDSTLNYFRNTIGLITYFLDEGCCAVYDPQMFQWWGPELWHKRVFEPAKPMPLSHTVTLYSPEERDPQRKWYHTRGMRKFGRPDISVHNVPSDQEEGVLEMIERFIQLQAMGIVVPVQNPLRKRFSARKSTESNEKTGLSDSESVSVYHQAKGTLR